MLYLLLLPQIAGAVAITGWLAYRSGKRSVEDVADILRDEYSHRIEESLSRYLELPRLVNRVNAQEITEHANTDLETLGRRLYHQIKSFETLGYNCYGTEAGDYDCYVRTPEGDISREMLTGKEENRRLERWSLTDDGQLLKRLEVVDGYDPRVRPWYKAAVEAQGPTWAKVYIWFGIQALCLDAVQPFYHRDGKLKGVFDAGFTLSHFSRYLEQLQIGRSGRTFITGGDGKLVASSAAPVLRASPDGKSEQVPTVEILDSLSRAAARHLFGGALDLSQIKVPRALSFYDGKERIFLQVTPVNPSIVNKDWFIVVAIPERDFMTRFNENTEHTKLLSALALMLAFLLTALTINWIAQPLVQLSRKAKRVGTGDYSVVFTPRSKDEIGTLTQTLADMVTGLGEREKLRDAFGRYVTPELAEQVMNEPDALKPGGKVQVVTILMSDLRGFTTLTAQLGPKGMIELLNVYLGRMTEVIVAHGGMINEFIGDAILVLFGAPETGQDDTDRAVRCAIAMQQGLDKLNHENAEEGIAPLEMGIAVNTGEVILGNIGSEQRVKYGVVGDTVNMTGRIESLTVGGQALISQSTYAQIETLVEVGEQTSVEVKGGSSAVVVYDLRAVTTEPALRMPVAANATLKEVDLHAEIYVLRGKTLDGVGETARAVGIGEKVLELETPRPYKRFENLRIRLRDESGGWSEELYGKVGKSWNEGSEEEPTCRCQVTLTAGTFASA